MDLNSFKGSKVDDVLDSIKSVYQVVRIQYPKGLLVNDHRPERLNINVDIHGYITSFNFG